MKSIPLMTLSLITACLALPGNHAFAQISSPNGTDIMIGSTGLAGHWDGRTGVFTVHGTDRDDIIQVAYAKDGTLLVNDTRVMASGKVLTSDNTHHVEVHGGAGIDVLIANTGYDRLDGGEGPDVLVWDNGGEKFYGSYYQGDLLIYNDDKEEAPLGGYYTRDLLIYRSGNGDSFLEELTSGDLLILDKDGELSGGNLDGTVVVFTGLE